MAQDRREVTVFRRTNHWLTEGVSDEGGVVALTSVGQSLTLAEICEDVRFAAAGSG